MTPLDIIATAIYRHMDAVISTIEADYAAKFAADTLADERIVENAVQALKDDGWEQTHEGPQGVGELSDEDLTNIAATVLRSVGGGA